MLQNGQEKCNCVKTECERHGQCVLCLEHHRKFKKHPPYCQRKSRNKQKKQLPRF